MVRKRSWSRTEAGDEEVDNELRSLAAEQETAREQQRTRRRRYEYASMSQVDESNARLESYSQEEAGEAIPSGYIKKICLRNFMCHENFELELGPKLNFIVGSNGSGKSAILTAITIGLGAKASETQRGSALKNLIREGAHQARIILHLENGKHGSYNPEEFGSEIIVKRTIKSDGTSTFSLQSEAGHEISSKKKDIQAVMDYFSLPINNPMCFLSQDAARSFLTASNAHDKYVLFMKATLLQEVSDSLEKAKEINQRAQTNMAYHLRNLKDLQDEYEESKRLLQEFNKAADLNEQKRLLQGKSLWIDVKQNTEANDRLKAQIEAQEERIRHYTEKIRSKKDRIERFMVDRDAQTGNIDIKVAELSEKAESHKQAERAMKAAESTYETEREKEETLKSTMKECEDKVKTLDELISRTEQELRDEMGGDREQMRKEILEIEAANEELRSKSSSIAEEEHRLRGDETMLIERRQADVNDKQRSINSKRRELERITRENSGFLDNFDRQMSVLLRKIRERATEFTVLPVGPLGMHVTVKSGFENWSRAIQRQLSPWLNNFLVATQEDSRLLRQIIRSCHIKANISITNYSLGRSFRYRKAQSQYPSMLDALEFSSTDIEFFFIDTAYVANIVLIEDRNEARQYLLQRPQDVRLALALRDRSSGYQIVGGRRIDTVTYNNRSLLKVASSANSDSNYLHELIQQETMELQNIKRKYDIELEETKSQLRTLRRKFLQVEAELGKNDSTIETLRRRTNRVVDTGRLESAINEKRKIQEMIASYEARSVDLFATIRTLEEEIQPLKFKFDETRNIYKAAQEEVERLRSSLGSRTAKIQKWKDDIEDMQREIEEFKELIRNKRENVKTLEKGIKEQKANASEFCSQEQADNSDLPNDQQEIRRELDKLSRSILRAEREVGISQQDAVKLFEQSRSKYTQAQEKCLEINQTLDMIFKSIQARVLNFQSALRTTCLDADLDFRASLKVRRLSGHLSFINASKQLEIYILTPNDENARSVDNLSGGEKSFAQMALLLATWKPMRSRIIALDEFDVFMDQVNRKIGTSLILKKLKDNSRTQTIIITPQDIGRIADVERSGVTIHRMRDPERQSNASS
ncbi:hypothetical protein HG537_0E01590 [Torulaspora globosa]|uniref:RecF/RecN/SMC N-terminal domain-containing protein n=1 Tax=Torulaspora globosa TaxID=48254 RepID=A0A7H9HSU7_9SACH|nr:hypothetical protein HG537_0E01590 [Torulaspora sp. CBS 2947]